MIIYLVLIIFGSFLYTLGFPTLFTSYEIHSPWASVLGLSLIFSTFQFDRKDIKREFWALFSLMFTLNYLGYYWLAYTIKEYGLIDSPFNLIISGLFTLIVAPQFWGLLVFVYAIKRVNVLKKAPSILQQFILAAGVTFSEIFIPQQFPGHLGHSFLTLAPYLKPSTIFGVSLYSFLGYWLAFSIAGTLKKGPKHFNFIPLLFMIFFLSWGFLSPLQNIKKEDSIPFNIRIVQANIGNLMKTLSEKGDPISVEEVIRRYYKLSSFTLAPNKEKERDLIIWPETAYPFTLQSQELMRPGASSYHWPLFQSLMAHPKAELFFGGYQYDEEALKDPFKMKNSFENIFNTGFLMNREGEIKQAYHKRKLLAFGETIPIGPFTPYVANLIPSISFFASGNKAALFETGNEKQIRFINLICYEILLPRFVRQSLEETKSQVHFILNTTNDSWFGKTMEPYQHLFLSRWRSIEFQMPVIRSTNTGVTSILYPDGSESEKIGIGEEKVLDETLYLAKDPQKTIYQKWGLLPLLGIIILGGIITFVLRKKTFPNKIM